MQGRIRADGMSKKNSINSILVGILTGALLLGPGCQTDSARGRDNAAIRSAQLANGQYDNAGQSKQNPQRVRLDDFESLEALPEEVWSSRLQPSWR